MDDIVRMTPALARIVAQSCWTAGVPLSELLPPIAVGTAARRVLRMREVVEDAYARMELHYRAGCEMSGTPLSGRGLDEPVLSPPPRRG